MKTVNEAAILKPHQHPLCSFIGQVKWFKLYYYVEMEITRKTVGN